MYASTALGTVKRIGTDMGAILVMNISAPCTRHNLRLEIDVRRAVLVATLRAAELVFFRKLGRHHGKTGFTALRAEECKAPIVFLFKSIVHNSSLLRAFVVSASIVGPEEGFFNATFTRNRHYQGAIA